MRINERLNLVIPCYRDDGEPYAWAHSVPLSREAFNANYVLLGRTFEAIHMEGMGVITGPRLSALALRDVAKALAGPDGDPDQITAPFLNELRRVSNVMIGTPAGWESVPLQEAVSRKLLDDDDIDEVESILVFFMLGSRLYPKNGRQTWMDGFANRSGARILSSNSTEFIASLRTSTATASSGASAPVPPAAAPAASMVVTAPDGTTVTSSLPV